MDGKITLISPPDIFENSNLSILLMHLSSEDQDNISAWLYKNNIKKNINFYVYDDQDSIEWILYASAICKYSFIDLNHQNTYTQTLASYLLGKHNFYYKINDNEIASIYNFINNKRIIHIENFLEDIFNSDIETN
jgi:hypothetical protein